MHGADVAYFDRLAGLYERAMPAADATALNRGLVRAERDIERLLDVGGGTGRGAAALDVPERVVVDAAGGMLQRARGKGLGAVQGDATRLPVRDEAVDAVLVVDALHHMPNATPVVEEATRVLRPGGALVVREFDPTTVRGWLLAGSERLIGFDSTFYAAGALTGRMGRAGLETSLPERGFTYTAVGVKPR